MSRNIKLTVPSYVVLGMVEAMGEATPYMMKRLAGISLDNFRAVRHAQFYSEPDRLAEAGYLTVKQEAEGRRRKHYRITPAGSQALARWLTEPAERTSELRDEAVLKIFFGANPIEAAEQRVCLHENKLSEYKQLLNDMGTLMTEGQRLSLRAGIEVERHWIEIWRKISIGELNGAR
ncbi:MAG: PadR family transcriptional regulator [Actinobacteria bacterium]|nr:PadR family transcriptional regulator [Actinomycetota bacterium]